MRRTYNILALGYFCLLCFFGGVSSVAVATETPVECLIVRQFNLGSIYLDQSYLLVRNGDTGIFREIQDRFTCSVGASSLNFAGIPRFCFRTHFDYSGTVNNNATGTYVSGQITSDLRDCSFEYGPLGDRYGVLNMSRCIFNELWVLYTRENPPGVNPPTFTYYVSGWMADYYSGTYPNQHPSGSETLMINTSGNLAAWSIGSWFEVGPHIGLCLEVYYIPLSTGLTREVLAQMPWGWWDWKDKFITAGNGYLIIGFHPLPDYDNWLIMPPIPFNPYTGKPYLPGEFEWEYDASTGKWRQRNRYTNPLTRPTTPLGPNGQWLYGRRPGGNLINLEEGGLEWYWDGEIDSGSSGIQDGGYSNPVSGDSMMSSAALSLLQQIANNTGQTLTQAMGISSAIAGVRSDNASYHSDYVSFHGRVLATLGESRELLMGMINANHNFVQNALNGIGVDVNAIRGINQNMLSTMTSGFSGLNSAVSGLSFNLGNIDNSTASMNNKMTIANDYLSSLNSSMSGISSSLGGIGNSVSSIDNKVGVGNSFLESINTSIGSSNTRLDLIRQAVSDGFGVSDSNLQAIQEQFERAIAGSLRIEGKIVDISGYVGNGVNELSAAKETLAGMLRNIEEARYDTDQFRQDIANSLFKDANRFADSWEDYTASVWEEMAEEKIRHFESMEYLQEIVNLCDSMEQYFKLTWDPAQDALWWRVERIRWVQREEENLETLSDVKDNTANINDKMTQLINEVAGIPPPETPQLDVGELESLLQQVVNKIQQVVDNTEPGQGDEPSQGEGVDLSGIEDSLEVIKQRLQSIDRSVSGLMDVPNDTAVELNQVQKDYGKAKDFIEEVERALSPLDSFSLGFSTAFLGRVGNPNWFTYQTDFLGMELDFSLNWNDEKWQGITGQLDFIKWLEKLFVWIVCLAMCFRFAVKVNG